MQIQKLILDASYYTKRSLKYMLTPSEYEEIQTLPYEKINNKPIEKYDLSYGLPPVVILFKDIEENIEIQVVVEQIFFIKRSMDDDTILSKPVQINLKNKNEKALYKKAYEIQYSYDHSLSCLII